MVPKAPFYDLLKPVYEYGNYGVQLFWLLSGFIFFSQYFDRVRAKEVSGRAFAALRFSRLWPLYVSTALFMFLAQPVYRAVSHSARNFAGDGADWWDMLLAMFMANQWIPGHFNITLNGPSWSVSIELLAYALFFLVSRYAGRFAPLLAGAFALTILVTATREHDPIGQCISYFFLGGMVFFASRRYDAFKARSIGGHRAVMVAGAALLVLCGYVIGVHGLITPYLLPFFLTLVLACAAFVFPQVSGRGERAAVHLGNLTYGSYMLQFPILITVVTVFSMLHVQVPWQEPWMFFAWLIAPFALAVPVYHYFEMPAQRWLRRRFQVKGTKRSELV